jgi:hypothetical protein
MAFTSSWTDAVAASAASTGAATTGATPECAEEAVFGQKPAECEMGEPSANGGEKFTPPDVAAEVGW